MKKAKMANSDGTKSQNLVLQTSKKVTRNKGKWQKNNSMNKYMGNFITRVLP